MSLSLQASRPLLVPVLIALGAAAVLPLARIPAPAPSHRAPASTIMVVAPAPVLM
ncbi:MAG TPA: hypothetical protein VMQ93_10715 [Novosphingobium sp.]|nr:hypothetical protein [Novosphingobium sp.]